RLSSEARRPEALAYLGAGRLASGEALHDDVEHAGRPDGPAAVRLDAPEEANQQEDFFCFDVVAYRSGLLACVEKQGDRADHWSVSFPRQLPVGGGGECPGQSAFDLPVDGEAV